MVAWNSDTGAIAHLRIARLYMIHDSGPFMTLEQRGAESGALLMVIETPRGNRAKFKYDATAGAFRLHKLLPLGNAFPFHFGFVPSTLAEDGDPLDMLLLLEEPLPQGCVVEVRALGAIEAMQYAPEQAPVRNDRIIAVAAQSEEHSECHTLDDLDAGLVTKIEQFFVNYNLLEGKKFNPIGRADKATAEHLIQSAADAYAAAHDVAHI